MMIQLDNATTSTIIKTTTRKKSKMPDTNTNTNDDSGSNTLLSPGGGRKTAYAQRAWIPHQARRKRQEGKEANHDDDWQTLSCSFSNLAMAGLDGDDDEGEDYLAKSICNMGDLDVTLNTSVSSVGSTDRSSKKKKKKKVRRGRKPGAGGTAATKKYGGSGNSLDGSADSLTISGKSTGSNTMSTTKTKEELMAEIPEDIQKKLYKITDPNISMKKRVQLELEMKGSSKEEKKILLKFKDNFDRKMFLDHKHFEEEQHDMKIESDYKTAKKKEKEFQKELDEKRRREKEKELEKERRLKQMEDDAKRHAAKTIADGMSDIKDAAYVAATVTTERNQKEKQKEAEKLQKKINKFRENEGKDMFHGAQVLKEAIMEQKELPSKKAKKKAKKKKKERENHD